MRECQRLSEFTTMMIGTCTLSSVTDFIVSRRHMPTASYITRQVTMAGYAAAAQICVVI